MKQIVLAAGYATRLHPLTETTPKPLLPVGGTPMLERVLASSAAIGEINQTFIVTNHKFAAQFSEWMAGYLQAHSESHTAVIDDGPCLAS